MLVLKIYKKVQKQIADKLNEASKAPRFAVAAVGGAAGEAFVADVEEIGTLVIFLMEVQHN